jgi:histidinol-phosphatase (PHP family)
MIFCLPRERSEGEAMIANYHTHTPRCRHAEGTEAEYVQAAFDAGLEILGFSDHTPYWFPGDYYSNHRMFPNQLEEYCDAVRSIRKQNNGKLQIHLGVEVEYYPAYFAELLPRLRDNGIEYMLLGQHWVGSEIGEPYCGRATEDLFTLKRYCDQVVEAMQTGLFTYLAHPDLIKYVGEPKIYRQYIRGLCREAKACGVPLEINLLGIRTGRNYPNRMFWEVAAEENCDCIIGCDAHFPRDITDTEAEQKALALVRDLGLHLMDTVKLRSIG